MGHGERNANRAAGIADNKARIAKCLKSMDRLLKEWKIHVKQHEEEEKVTQDSRDTALAMCLELRDRIDYLELPFWGKAWSRFYWWREGRREEKETLKDVMKPMPLGMEEEADPVTDAFERATEGEQDEDV